MRDPPLPTSLEIYVSSNIQFIYMDWDITSGNKFLLINLSKSIYSKLILCEYKIKNHNILEASELKLENSPIEERRSKND